MSEIMETLEDPDAVVEGAAPEGADADADRVTKLQGLAITVCPKITAVFSMVGSACLIYLTLRDLLQHARLSKHEQQRNTSGRAPPPRSRNSSAAPPTSGRAGEAAGGGKRVLTNPTYARLVLGLSLGDFVASTAWFLTTWPIPKDTPEIYGVRLYLSARIASHRIESHRIASNLLGIVICCLFFFFPFWCSIFSSRVHFRLMYCVSGCGFLRSSLFFDGLFAHTLFYPPDLLEYWDSSDV